MTIKRNLFLWNQHKVRSNRGVSSEDKFTQVFGTIIPRQIPESSAWWKVVVSFACFLHASYSAARIRRRAEIWKLSATMLNQVGAIVLRRQCLELRPCACCGAMEPRASFSTSIVDVSVFCVRDISSTLAPSCCRSLSSLLVHA